MLTLLSADRILICLRYLFNIYIKVCQYSWLFWTLWKYGIMVDNFARLQNYKTIICYRCYFSVYTVAYVSGLIEYNSQYGYTLKYVRNCSHE